MIAKELVLTSLTLDPGSQLGIFSIIARNIGMKLLSMELLQFILPFDPCGTMRILNKTNLFERRDAFVRHGRRFAFLLEFVLIPLTFDPSSAGFVFVKVLWHLTMSTLFAIAD